MEKCSMHIKNCKSNEWKSGKLSCLLEFKCLLNFLWAGVRLAGWPLYGVITSLTRGKALSARMEYVSAAI